MIIKAYKQRIYPNKEQKGLIEKHFGANRWIYNWALNKKIEVYQKNKKSIGCFDLIRELPKLKKENEWLKEVSSQSLQQPIRNLDNAFTRFFRQKKGFPNFKSKRKSRNSFQSPQGNKIDFENKRLQFEKIGKIKIRLEKEIKGKIKTVIISKNNINQYFASIVVETPNNCLKKKLIKEKTTVGIDLGIKDFATLSTGKKIKNNKYLKKSERRLKVLHRRLSKKHKGSKNRKKAKFNLAKLYNKITNQRSDFLHKFTFELTHDNQVHTIAIEDLNVGGMIKNHCLAKSISDVAWSEFRRQLTYKCEWYGKNLIVIGRFEPSSKMCSCGAINNDLKLSDRIWTCKKCGLTHDRDILASQNIKKFAIEKQNLISPLPKGKEPAELSQ